MEVLRQSLGEWGPYQTRICLSLALPIIIDGMQVMMSVLIFYIPKHRCRIPGWQNDSYNLQDDGHGSTVARLIPTAGEDNPDDYSRCTIFADRNHSRLYGNSSDDMEACRSWVFDKADMESTLITQFSLVCERKGFRAHINMLYFAGGLVFLPISGYLCDRFGRKTVFYFATLTCLVVGVAAAFPPRVELFLVYRFLQGITGPTLYTSAFVLVMELVGPTKRTRAATVMTVVWLLGPMLLAPLSWVLRDWHWLQLVTVLPLGLCVGHWWLLPESARWLVLKNKTDAAITVLRKAARVNKRSDPATLLSSEDTLAVPGTKNKPPGVLSSVRQVVMYPRLVVRSLLIFFNWFVVSMAYYGLSLNVGNLAGDLRINLFLSCSVELLGYILAWVLLERLGRKRSHFCFMLLASLALLSTTLTVSLGGTDLQTATIALSMLGKLGSSASFIAVYLMSSELFPTVIRNLGLAFSAMSADVGNAVSAYVADLGLHVEGRFSGVVPLVVFGGLAILAALSTLFLPETLHRTLPDTLEDAVRFTEKRSEEELEAPGDEAQEGDMFLQETAHTPF